MGQDDSGQFITGRCGWSHMPPNTLQHYDWFNPAAVLSDIQDWRPDGLGNRTLVSAGTWTQRTYDWPGGYQPDPASSALWFVYWMQSMPGFQNGIPHSGGTMRNWWEYTADWDRALTTGTPPPQITRQPEDRSVRRGDSVVFEATAAGGEPRRFQWRRDGLDLPGETAAQLVVSQVDPASRGSYSVRVCNLAGCVDSAPALLQITNVPPVLAAPPARSTDEDVPLAVPIEVIDHETAPERIRLEVVSSDSSVVPGSGLSFQWDGQAWLLRVEPAAEASGTVLLSLTATDEDGDTAEGAVSLTVRPVNDPPSLAGIPAQRVSEGKGWEMNLVATDPDLPADELAFALLPPVPSGLSVDPATGRMSWAPGETQGPATYTVFARVTDAGTPPLQAEIQFLVAVEELNAPPVLGNPGPQECSEQSSCIWTLAAVDTDWPPNRLTFAFDGPVPDGAGLDPVTGVVTWTPSEGQGPGSHVLQVRVTDDGTPSQSATTAWVVTVAEVNRAPAFSPVALQVVPEGGTWSLALQANDPDEPANVLTYLAAAPLPEGAVLDPATGRLEWSPTPAQNNRRYAVSVIVRDDGVPPLSDTLNLVVIVGTEPSVPGLPDLSPIAVTEGEEIRLELGPSGPADRELSLAYALEDPAPEGAWIDPMSGEFVWIPSEEQGPSTNRIVVTVTDPASPAQGDRRAYTIVVEESNRAPVLPEAISRAAIRVLEGWQVALNLAAADPDVPANRLVYQLEGPLPEGASLDAVTGEFRWVVGESQGPGTHTFRLTVLDDGTPPLQSSGTFAVEVAEVNRAPELRLVPVRVVAEGEPWVVALAAVDADLPPQRLTYRLVGPVPEGVSLEPATGLLTWTPGEADGPGSYPLEVQVTDDGFPPLAASGRITVVVGEINDAPRVAEVPALSVAEGSELDFSIPAVDPDVPATPLAFAWEGTPPEGADLHPGTGRIRWIPSEAQGPGTHALSVRVTDAGDPPRSTAVTLPVRVLELNEPPALAPVPGQTVVAGTVLTLDLRASDPDLPHAGFVFGVKGSVPEGIFLDPETGRFEWAPTEDQAGTHALTFVVGDQGEPPLEASVEVSIEVRPPERPLQVTSAVYRAGVFTLSWIPRPGRSYRVQCTDHLENPEWQDLPVGPEPGTCTDSHAPPGQRFYRIVERDGD